MPRSPPCRPHRIHTELGVGTILCLQKDSDMAYFNLDIRPIQAACRTLGIAHVRFEIRDFDPFDLRIRLPEAVRVCAEAAASGRGPLYIHCTAGLGRAPAVAMAWMHWCKGYPLADAVTLLTSIRACNPKVQAIRQATVDVLYPQPAVDVDLVLTAATVRAARAQAAQERGGGEGAAGAEVVVQQPAVVQVGVKFVIANESSAMVIKQSTAWMAPCTATSLQGNTVDHLCVGRSVPHETPSPLSQPTPNQVAGLDVGWGQFLPLRGPSPDGSYRLHRRIAPGSYLFKFVVDGVWCCEDALPTMQDGENVNNLLDVGPQGAANPQQEAARERILLGGELTAEEQGAMAAAVCGGRPWYRRLLAWFGWS